LYANQIRPAAWGLVISFDYIGHEKVLTTILPIYILGIVKRKSLTAVRRTPPNFGDNLGIVNANYPQNLTNINQLVKRKTLILQGFKQLCQT